MDKQMLELMMLQRQGAELKLLEEMNKKTERFGLSLSREQAKELAVSRNKSLVKHHRAEFGKGILDQMAIAFCDSQYLNQDNYLETLRELVDLFYQFKNETQDKVSDDELLAFMREQYETVCAGDLEYLGSTCLSRFARAVREGYDGFTGTEGIGEYEQFSEEERWDSELYYQVLKDMFWE